MTPETNPEKLVERLQGKFSKSGNHDPNKNRRTLQTDEMGVTNNLREHLDTSIRMVKMR